MNYALNVGLRDDRAAFTYGTNIGRKLADAATPAVDLALRSDARFSSADTIT